MFKRNFYKLFSVLLIALMFFSIPAGTTALANSMENYSPSSSSELNQSTDKKLAVPDRKAIVEILNKDTGVVIENIVYLTPGTPIDEDSFNELNPAYELKKITINELSQAEKDEIGVRYVETIFDIGNFAISVAEYQRNPSFWTGFWVVADAGSMVFPGIPSISGVKRMMQQSTKLYTALGHNGDKIYGGIKKYSKLNVRSGNQRHHIFEQRFATKLNTTPGNMLCIELDSSTHNLATQKMRGKIPYGANLNNYSEDDILRAHQQAYSELWSETGDSLWEFLYKFAQTRQHTAR